jgi:hypothetical protein
MTNGQKTGSIIGSTVSGAMGGIGFGPVGLLAGAGIGALTSWLGNEAGDNKAKEEADRLSRYRTTSIKSNQDAYMQGIENAN